jgi:hypothetical protein
MAKTAMSTKTTASITGLAAVVVASLLTAKSSLLSTSIATFVHGAVTGNVTNLATLGLEKYIERCTFVAIRSGAAHSTTLLRATGTFLLRTFPGEMSSLSATVASLALWGFWAISRKMAGFCYIC